MPHTRFMMHNNELGRRVLIAPKGAVDELMCALPTPCPARSPHPCPASHPLPPHARPAACCALGVSRSHTSCVLGCGRGKCRVLDTAGKHPRVRRCGTLSESNQIAAAAIRNFDFASAALPKEVAAKGVGKENIPRYAYRDDGLLVYDAIKKYLTEYVDTTYGSAVRLCRSLWAYCIDVYIDTELNYTRPNANPCTTSRPRDHAVSSTVASDSAPCVCGLSASRL